MLLRPAVRKDARRLAVALAQLSQELGDGFAVDADRLALDGFDGPRAFRCVLAETSDAAPLHGVALYSPFYSTKRGGAGIYVSDLWVGRAARGVGLGKRLLAACLADAGDEFGRAHALRLTTYDADGPTAGFYARLGFVEKASDRHLILEGEALAALERAM